MAGHHVLPRAERRPCRALQPQLANVGPGQEAPDVRRQVELHLIAKVELQRRGRVERQRLGERHRSVDRLRLRVRMRAFAQAQRPAAPPGATRARRARSMVGREVHRLVSAGACHRSPQPSSPQLAAAAARHARGVLTNVCASLPPYARTRLTLVHPVVFKTWGGSVWAKRRTISLKLVRFRVAFTTVHVPPMYDEAARLRNSPNSFALLNATATVSVRSLRSGKRLVVEMGPPCLGRFARSCARLL